MDVLEFLHNSEEWHQEREWGLGELYAARNDEEMWARVHFFESEGYDLAPPTVIFPSVLGLESLVASGRWQSNQPNVSSLPREDYWLTAQQIEELRIPIDTFAELTEVFDGYSADQTQPSQSDTGGQSSG